MHTRVQVCALHVMFKEQLSKNAAHVLTCIQFINAFSSHHLIRFTLHALWVSSNSKVFGVDTGRACPMVHSYTMGHQPRYIAATKFSLSAIP